MMEVNIKEVNEIISNLLLKLRDRVGDTIEINHDFYWDISLEELYEPYQQPKDFSLGQISFDIEQISRLTKQDDAIMYDLKRIAEILKVIANENQIAL